MKGIETRKRNKEIELSNKKTEDIEDNKVSEENMKNSNSKSDLVTLEMETEETEDSENSSASKNAERRRRIKNKCIKCLDKSINYKVEYDMNKGDRVEEIHSNAEKFDSKTEESFKVLQIFTAVCDSFSHGANDVANSIGPFRYLHNLDKWIYRRRF